MAKAMKVEVEVGALVAAVAETTAVASRKSTMPILSYLRLSARDGRLEAVGTDLDLTVAASLPARVEGDGRVCVPARAFHEVLRSLTGEKVKLEVGTNERLTIRCGGAEFRLVGLNDQDFPSVQVEEKDLTFRAVPADALARLLRRAAAAASTDPSRPNLTNVVLERDQNEVVGVATDGHRMVVAREAGEWVPKKWMLPLAAVAAVRRLVEGVEGDVKVAETGNSVVVKAGDKVLVARQGEGGFPDWRQVLPKDRKGGLTVKSAALLETTKRVGLVAAKRVLTLKLGGKALGIEGTDPERGEAKEEVEAMYDGAEAKLGIDGRYLADAVEGAGSDEVAVTFGEQVGMEAIEVRPVSAGGYLAVIMPVRI